MKLFERYTKMNFKHIFFMKLSLISFVFVFYSAGKLMIFLSVPNKHANSIKNDSIIWPLLTDVLLLAAFVLQHTAMLQFQFKQFIYNIGLDVIYRSIYNLITSIILLVLIKYWRNITEVSFWNIDISNSGAWFTFSAVHLFAWSVIYTGCLFMDISELLGVKQVYYDMRKMAQPMTFKSLELRRLYNHTRHPSFSAFLLIFWIFPVMSLDRFFLALILTGYMYISWRTDKNDLHYQQVQYDKKSQEFTHMHY